MPPVLLFDGVCNLCDFAVNFVLDHERGTVLRFGSLQSKEGAALARAHGGAPEGLGSVIFIEGGRRYERSAAVVRVARYLRWPWRWVRAGWIVPRPLRDALYDVVASHRYQWFGKQDACRVPTPALRARFLDHSPGAEASIASA